MHVQARAMLYTALCFRVLMCTQCNFVLQLHSAVVGSTDNFESFAEASRISAGTGLGDWDFQTKLRKS